MIRNKLFIIELICIFLLLLFIGINSREVYEDHLKSQIIIEMKNEIAIINDSTIDINLLFSKHDILKLVYEDGVLVEYPSSYVTKDVYKFDELNEYEVYRDYKGYYAYCNFGDTYFVKRMSVTVLSTANFSLTVFLTFAIFYVFILFLYLRNRLVKFKFYRRITSKVNTTFSNVTMEFEVDLFCEKIAWDSDYSYLSLAINNVSEHGILYMDDKNNVIYNNQKAKDFVVEENGVKTIIEDDIITNSLNVKNDLQNVIQIRDKFYGFNITKVKNKGVVFYTMIIDDITKELNYRNNQVSFFNQASHELRTPLTTIQGLVELLTICELESNDKEKTLEISLQECRRLELLISSIIDISKRTKTDDLFSKVCVSLLLENMIEKHTEYRVVNIEKNIPNNVFLLCDKIKVDVILDQLVKNACIHTIPKALVTIDLINNNGLVSLIITNKCRDFLDGEINRIVEPLFRCQSTIDLEIPTAGMGLALVKGLCDAYKYQLEFICDDNEFTTILKLYDNRYK